MDGIAHFRDILSWLVPDSPGCPAILRASRVSRHRNGPLGRRIHPHIRTPVRRAYSTQHTHSRCRPERLLTLTTARPAHVEIAAPRADHVTFVRNLTWV